jgi:hypothetical protein
MKRTFVIALLAASPLAAQTGGNAGASGATRQRNVAPSAFHNHSVFEIGAATPSGDYAKLPSQQGRVYFNEASITPVFNSGQGAMQGMYASYHRVSYVGVPLPSRVKLGVDVGLAVAYLPVDWAAIYRTSTFAKNNGDIVGDVTLGPVLSLNPSGKLFIDASARLGYGLMGLSRMKVLDYALTDSTRGIVEDANDKPASGRASGGGLRVRYGAFLAGWEVHRNLGPRTRTYTVTRPNVGEPQDFNYTVNSKVPTSRLSFGFVF